MWLLRLNYRNKLRNLYPIVPTVAVYILFTSFDLIWSFDFSFVNVWGQMKL